MGLLRSKAARGLLILLTVLLLPALATAQDGAAKTDEPPVDMQWGLKIPMRDGVQLNATVYLPHANSQRLPVIFTFTPYIGDSYTPRAMYFARHGYVYALVDVRGRCNSGGSFEPFVNEGRDGYDVVEWFARQPYCDGKVAMWGGSYAGFDQWTVLKEFPPHLATIVPAAAAHPGVDWKYADTLESISNATRTLYLSSDGSANGVFHSGRLTEKPVSGDAADSWTYDPLNVRALELATDPDEPYITSQRPLMDLNGESLVYHSDLLLAPLEISGFPKLTVWLSMDVPDTDLTAVLYEIKPSGESVMLTSATMRARYRDSLRDAKPVPLNEPVKYVFDDFTFFSRRLAKGSRIRLAIASLNAPDVEKNYNSGAVVADETAKDARTAHIRLLHDAAHPGTLALPVVQ